MAQRSIWVPDLRSNISSRPARECALFLMLPAFAGGASGMTPAMFR
jgi:hypothetical protein